MKYIYGLGHDKIDRIYIVIDIAGTPMIKKKHFFHIKFMLFLVHDIGIGFKVALCMFHLVLLMGRFESISHGQLGERRQKSIFMDSARNAI